MMDVLLREPSRDVSLANGGDTSPARIPFPVHVYSAAFDARFGAFSTDRGIACVDLKHAVSSGRSKLICVLPTAPHEPVAVNHTRLATGGDSCIRLYDFSINIEPLLFKLPYALPRCRKIISIDWSMDSNVLAGGSQNGSVQVWDVRSPHTALSHFGSHIFAPADKLKFNRFSSDFLLATAQGDAVMVWDFRSMRAPLRHAAVSGPLPWRSKITALDWISNSGDLCVASESDGIFTVNYDSGHIDILSEPPSPFSPTTGLCEPITTIPSMEGGKGLVVSSRGGRVRILDPTSDGAVVQEWELPSNFLHAKNSSMGYLQDSRVLCCMSEETLVMYPVSGIGGAWSGGSMGGTRQLHPVVSLTATEMSASEELTRVCESVVLLGRRLRRLYLRVNVEESGVMEIVIRDEATSTVQLNVVLRTMNAIEWEVWWSSLGPPTDLSTLPTPESIVAEHLSQIPWDSDQVGQGEIAVSVFRDLIALVNGAVAVPATSTRTQSLDESVSPDDDSAIPFPPTCGVCWSPRGDLFRFHSLKGLSPWPEHRGRLTMLNFNKLREAMKPTDSAGGGGAGGCQSVSLNAFSTYMEPDPDTSMMPPLERSSSAIDDATEASVEDALDAEFNQTVTTDQCVQFLPATVFEATVEDHWFASLAPVVDFALAAALPNTLAEFIENHFHLFSGEGKGTKSPIKVVYDIWLVLAQTLGGPQRPTTFALIDHFVKTLYVAEQTQTIAILAGLLFTLFPHTPHHQLFSPTLQSTVCIIVHEHANLFQRLECFHASRVLNQYLDSHTEGLLPKLIDSPELLVFQSSTAVPSNCGVCLLPVHGLGRYCPACGHGGHLRHMRRLKSDRCVNARCDCPCGARQTISRTTSGSRRSSPPMR